mgnify:CR=1 FL=1
MNRKSIMEKKVYIGNDTAGYYLKSKCIEYLEGKGIAVADKGCYNKDSVDYPAFGHAVAKAVANGECEKGIVICTTGIGISISANKVPGVRCALCADSFSAKMTRLHNDANVLCLGGRVVTPEKAIELVDIFLDTKFSGEERHQRRIDQIIDLENRF